MQERKISRRLTTELILGMAMPLGAFALILMLVSGFLAERREREVIGESLHRVAARISGSLEARLSERRQDIVQLGWLANTSYYVEHDAASRLYDNTIVRQPAFAWVGFANQQGEVLIGSAHKLVGSSVADHAIFGRARNGFYLNSPGNDAKLARMLGIDGKGSTRRFLGLSTDVHDHQDVAIGVGLAYLNWSWIEKLIDTMRIDSDRNRELEIFLIDRDDQVIANATAAQEVQLPQTPRSGNSAHRRFLLGQADGSNERFLISWADQAPGTILSQLGWRVVVRQPVEIALSPVRDLRIQLGGAAVLLTMGILALAWVQARRIASPLGRIAQAADTVTRGETYEIPTGSRLYEVESLACSLQHMIDTLTHREAALDEMQNLALHDHLTGLHNRRALNLHVEKAVARTQRSGEAFAVFALDLDGFKPVNDTWGHATGDKLLKEVARRLTRAVRREEMLARLGGDEFVILIIGEPGTLGSDARIVGERVLTCFDEPFEIDGHLIGVGCSIGIATGQPGDNPALLLPRADAALYQAKKGGRRRIAWWSPDETEISPLSSPG